MPRRQIGQEALLPAPAKRSSLDEIASLIDWTPIERQLDVIYSAQRGEASWPPLAMFRAMLLAIWHDLSDVKLADALDDRASFRRFCGFARTEATPERTALVRFRRELLRHCLDERLFDEITAQLKDKAIRIKTGTMVDATVVGSASQGDDEARWSGHRSRKAVHGYKAHVGADADTALVEKLAVTPGNPMMGAMARPRCPMSLAMFTPIAAIGVKSLAKRCAFAAVDHVSSPRMFGPKARRRVIGGSPNGTARSITSDAGSRRSLALGNALTDFGECDGEGSPRPHCRPV